MNTFFTDKDGRKYYSKSEYYQVLLQKSGLFKATKVLDSENFLGTSPPSIFVGSKLRYPAVNVGILSPAYKNDMAWLYDNPNEWVKRDFGIRQVAEFRTSLINSRFETRVSEAKNQGKLLETAQEIGMSIKQLDVEIMLKKKPRAMPDFDQIRLPMGPAAPIKKAILAENSKIPKKVDKVVDDVDLKAVEAIDYLYDAGFNEHSLTQLLSIGVLGAKKNRKLVSTRWSITTVDDMLGKKLIKKIKDYRTIDEYMLFSGNYFGNYYYILMFPNVWQYELFEGYLPRSLWNQEATLKWSTDWESIFGRKNYAFATAGGYYSVRYPTAQYLYSMKRQASVLVIRFETPEYTIPLGVWVCRESTRKALASKPFIFKLQDELLTYTKKLIYGKFRYNIDEVLKLSKLLGNVKGQRRLFEFSS